MELTERYGYQMYADLNLTKQAATGLIQITAGHGFQIIIGAGRHFTMAAGLMKEGMAGIGFRVMNGLLPGLHGD